MNKTVISTDRLKELEAVEELNIQLLTENITIKAQKKVLRDKVRVLEAKLNNMKGYGNH